MAPPGTALSKSDSLIPLVPTLSLMPQDNRQAPFGTRVGQSMTNPTSSNEASRDESRDRSRSVLEIRLGFVSGEEVHLHPNAPRSCQILNTYLPPAHFQLRFRGLACRVP